jgi:ABC-type polysaccharide/polyol phosphate transport system ATPase subunit
MEFFRMDQTSIHVSSVGVKFNLGFEKYDSRNPLKILLMRSKKKEFWALKNIDFETKKGEILGIIGGNGAGKSTLLKIIAGIYPATEGDVRIDGNIAPLIELGAAFNPELTGAENIYLTGSIFRIPRKMIKQNFDKIIDFSGLRSFIDSPIKNYSSGMFIRLAFSIVIFFRPDIVLIDEVFSVGDRAFQQKSFDKILSFQKKGATILLVSHDTNLITQICDRTLVLSKGKMSFLGSTEDAVNHYHQLIKSGEGLESEKGSETIEVSGHDSRRWGNKEVEIQSVRFVDENGRSKANFNTGDYFEVQFTYISHLQQGIPVFGTAINTIYKLLIYGPNTLETEPQRDLPRRGTVRFIIPSLPLFEGDYLFSVSAYDQTLSQAYDHHDMMYHFQVSSPERRDFGCVSINSRWEIEEE